MVLLNTIASVTNRNLRELNITVYDPSLLKDVQHSINNSSFGVNATLDNNSNKNILVVKFPKATKDTKLSLVKQSKQYGEQSKTKIRKIRQKALNSLKKKEKDGEVTKDDVQDIKEQIQLLTNEYSQQINLSIQEKEEDLME